MYELVLTVCTFVQGAQCKELPAIAIEQLSRTPAACAVASQMKGAKWVGEHPNFYVHRMTCQPARGIKA